MAHILIIGRTLSDTRNYLLNNGHTYTVLQDKTVTKFPEKRFKNRVVTDFSTPDIFVDTAREIHAKKPIEGLLVTYENYIVPCAHIAKALDLPGISVESATACTDKELMREKFSNAPEKISPSFQVVASRESLIEFANSHDFPLILKPANLSKSLLVSRCDTLDELLVAYDKTMDRIDAIYQRYAPNNTPKLLVEEFLEGSIHSVDAFIDADGMPHVLENIVDYRTGYDVGYDDNFHYSRLLPTQLSSSDVQAIRHCGEVGCKALGMTSSPAHIEIILTKNGPRIVEIGARNGGYRERMHRLANDIDILGNALALSLNLPLDLAAKRHDSVAVLELFPKQSGTFAGLTKLDKLKTLDSLSYLSVKAKLGQHVGKSSEGYKMCAVIILANKDFDVFSKDLSFVDNRVLVLTDKSS